MSTNPQSLTATLAKGLEVLELVAEQPEASLGWLAEKLAMPAPTVFRIVSTLAASGYVEKAGRGRYRLTLKTWQIGAQALHRSGLGALALPAMQKLAEACAEAVHLSVLQGDAIVIVEKVDCTQPVRVDTFAGLRAPLHCSATGKAILAFLAPAARATLLPERLARFTPATIATRAALERELAEVRRLGWAHNREEWRQGVCAAAVPLRDGQGTVIASLSVTVPTDRFTDRAVRAKFVPGMQIAAKTIEARFHPADSSSNKTFRP